MCNMASRRVTGRPMELLEIAWSYFVKGRCHLESQGPEGCAFGPPKGHVELFLLILAENGKIPILAI